MEQSELNLCHRPFLDAAFKAMSIPLSEYSFANLYLFRHVHSYKIVFGDHIYVLGTSYDGFRFIMPTSFDALEHLQEHSELNGLYDGIYPLKEEWASLFSPHVYEIFFKDDDSDYLFDVPQMAHFSGRHLSKKRNLVAQLLKQYDVACAPLDLSQKEAAQHILHVWAKNIHKNRNIVEESLDIQPCSEAIELLEPLQLEGVVFYIGQKPIGFMIGEALTPNTYVLHFSKADIQFKGIYQYMYKAFCQKLEGSYHFLNMEQDLGRKDLRQAKHSYHPIQMCKKYWIIPRKPPSLSSTHFI